MATSLFNLPERKQVGGDHQYAGYPHSHATGRLSNKPHLKKRAPFSRCSYRFTAKGIRLSLRNAIARVDIYRESPCVTNG